MSVNARSALQPDAEGRLGGVNLIITLSSTGATTEVTIPERSFKVTTYRTMSVDHE